MAVRTALDLWCTREHDTVTLSSGCSSIDDAMGGGFRNGMITEICGEASAGKTQLCLQLLLQCCLPQAVGGLGATACYISTESIGSIKRLHDLASAYHGKYSAVLRKRKRDEIGEGATFFLDNIFIEQIYEVDALVEFLQLRLPKLLASHKTKLVVIDSIAALFRSEATSNVKEASERSRLMFHIANCMRILSAQFQAIFVVTNQVTGNISDGIAAFSDRASQIKPALGLSWSNCINQRLMLHRMRRGGGTERRVEVVMSPYLPRNIASFQVTNAGITPL